MAFVEVVEDHDGGAAALDFFCIDVKKLLFQMETLVPDMGDTCAAGDVVACFHLCHEVGFDMGHDDGDLLPIDILAGGGEILCLRGVIELEEDGVVYMAELVHVVEADLEGDYVVEERPTPQPLPCREGSRWPCMTYTMLIMY